MMLPSHLLATLVACALVALVRPLSPREWILALAFGVAIDLDHLLQLPAYLMENGWRALQPTEVLHWGAAWQGFMHTPWALVIVLPACFVFASWIPAAAWGLHMVQDFVIARHYVVFGSATEWAIVGALFLAFAALVLRDHQAHGSGAALHEHVLARAMMALPRR